MGVQAAVLKARFNDTLQQLRPLLISPLESCSCLAGVCISYMLQCKMKRAEKMLRATSRTPMGRLCPHAGMLREQDSQASVFCKKACPFVTSLYQSA